MNHNHVHAVAEIVKKADTTIGAAGGVNAVAKGVSAWQAFREYNWLKAALVTNAVGDLRGMVLSKQWRAAFQFTVKTGKVLDKLGAFAGIAVGIAESYPEIDDIINSKDPWNIKGARLSTQVSAVAFNFLTGIVTGPAHLLLTS